MNLILTSWFSTYFKWTLVKVTDEKTGPGVNCPTAIASINCVLNKKPVATNSASRNAKTARMM